MSDEEKRWPFDGFYLKLAEAQREYEQEQHIDPASLTEEGRQQKLQEILDCIKASRKKKKEADEQLDPIVPEEEPETAGATPHHGHAPSSAEHQGCRHNPSLQRLHEPPSSD